MRIVKRIPQQVEISEIGSLSMIVDLNLKGKQVVVIGGGREATRKVDSLMTQDCEIHVFAESFSEDVLTWADNRQITLHQGHLDDGQCLEQFDNLILVMAVSDDSELNRALCERAKQMRMYSYAADDPDASDFSHPAVVNLHDKVQVAISTRGKSPLMARSIRERIEGILKSEITQKDCLEIELLDAVRASAKEAIFSPEERKQFLYSIHKDEHIQSLLTENQLERALEYSLKKLYAWVG